MTTPRWPEGPAADPHAARERYDSDLQAARAAARAAIRPDLPAAHAGPVVVAAAGVCVGVLAGPIPATALAAAFAAFYLTTLLALLLRGRRGRAAARQAYLLAFGWADRL